MNNTVPVLSIKNKPLMPTAPSRARRWIKQKRATPFWKNGIFCIRMNEVVGRKRQRIVVAVDPGSKKHGFTIKSKAHTHLNAQVDAITWVKDNLETRRMMRRSRRGRNTPYRQPRFNNRKSSISSGRLPPSTKARWQVKTNLIKKWASIYPLTDVIIEDIKAQSRKGRENKQWNLNFAPIQAGKSYFKKEIESLGMRYHTNSGKETKDLRDKFGLKKSKDKLGEKFECHAVDSWVMANKIVKGHTKPDNEQLMFIKPIKVVRRQLHMLQHKKGGVRPRAGGTVANGIKINSIVNHPKYGKCLVAGWDKKGRISLKSISGKPRPGYKDYRLTRIADPKDCKFLSYNRYYFY